jgi:hypothetical protein
VLTLEDYEKLNPTCEVAHEGSSVRYLTPSTHLKWRVDSLFSKEPSTIEWIAGFGRDEVLVQRDLLLYDIKVMEPQAADAAPGAAPKIKFSF